MKLILFALLLSTLTFANYAYQGENSGKIDMHGGKKTKLIDKPSKLSSKPFLLGNIGLQNDLEKKDKEEKKTIDDK